MVACKTPERQILHRELLRTPKAPVKVRKTRVEVLGAAGAAAAAVPGAAPTSLANRYRQMMIEAADDL